MFVLPVNGETEVHMFAAIFLVLSVASGASTGSTVDPVQLLHNVAKSYRHLRSYEFAGHLTATIPGTGVRLRVQTVDAEAGHSFVPENSSLVQYGEAKQFRKVTFTNPERRPKGVAMPTGWGSYGRIDADVKSAIELPPQTIIVDGAPVQCRVIQVSYGKDFLHSEEQTKTYWIDPNRFLVLKQEFAERQGRGQPPVFWHWVYAVDSVKLNQPPPRWLVDLSGNLPVDHARPEWVGRTAPSFTLSDLNGHKVDSSSMSASVVVLDFWAVWCGPCRKELPILETLSRSLKSQGVQVWGISIDDDPAMVKRWMSENHTEFQTLVDPDEKAANKFEVKALPSLVVINRSRKVTSYYVGNQTEHSLRLAIESALRENASAK